MDAADVVAARKFVLVDDDGNPRAQFTAQSTDPVGIQILDNTGENGMVMLSVSQKNESPILVLTRPEGRDGNDLHHR
jgi:hypothetical protein